MLEVINHSKWKPIKSAKQVKAWTTNDQERLLVLKIETKLHIPILKLFEFLSHPENTKHMLGVGDIYLGAEIYENNDNYKEYRLMYHFPFPFSDRDTIVSQWTQPPINDTAAIVYEDVPEPKRAVYKRNHGFVRSITKGKNTCITMINLFTASGYYLQVDPSNSNSTVMTTLSQFNPKGSVPSWLMSLFISKLVASAVKAKDFLEKYSSKRSFNK